MAKYTKEGRTAEKMAELVNDLTLNLDMVGIYLADLTSSILYNRLYQVFDSARTQKEYTYSQAYQRQMRNIDED
jgi:hypothetical protein